MKFTLNSHITKVISVIVFLIAIISSYLVNTHLLGDKIYENLLTGFGPPGVLVFLALYFNRMNKIVRYIILIFGISYFLFVCSYFLIGFHNPHWSN